MSAEPVSPDAVPSLVDLLIAEQQELTAVEAFSEFHERESHSGSTQADRPRRYEALMPTRAPDPSAREQYAFRVDLDACTGCKACVTACHSLNGLEEGETWRAVGLVETSAPSAERLNAVAEPQTVTTACHHCADPACLSGCPVNAYDKDPHTGVVRHLDDQCIGCRYCQLMCPYDVPKYSERLGIVRKCDLCHGRLAAGEAPACVQGCPNEAIQIAIVQTGKARESSLLPLAAGAMPDSKWTQPTTLYVSKKQSPAPNGVPADLQQLKPSEGHLPLAIMLVLTQAAVGALCLDLLVSIAEVLGGEQLGPRLGLVTLGAVCGFAGLAASTFHLGRPQWAFRAFLGLRTSWMSREIVVFGAFASLMAGALAASWLEGSIRVGGFAAEDPIWGQVARLRAPLVWGAALSGLAGLYCSIQIYAVTGRPLWRFDRTAFRFGGTALNLGLMIGNLAFAAAGGRAGPAFLCLGLIAVFLVRRRLEEVRTLEAATEGEAIAFERTRALLAGPLSEQNRLRSQLQWASGFGLPLVELGALLIAPNGLMVVVSSLLIVLSGFAAAFVERSHFFRSEAMPAMPGVG